MKISILIGITLTAVTCAASQIGIAFDGSTEIISTLPAKLLATMPSSYITTNLATSNKTGAAMLTNFDSQVGPLGAHFDALVFEMGSIDLAAGVSTNTIKTNLAAYFAKANSAFLQVFYRPISPRSANIGNFTEVNRVAINAWAATTYPACVVPVSYEPRIYAAFDHSWTNYTAGNPYFLDAYRLNNDGEELNAAAMRHKFQKENFLPTVDPTVTAKAFSGVTVSGIVGNEYVVYATLDQVHGPWDIVDTFTLEAVTEYWIDLSGATNRFYRVLAAIPE